MTEFFDENKRDEMKRKWMRLAMEAQEDGNTALANHYLKAAFVETDTDAALKGEKLGTLKQGYMSKGPDYKWDFPMSNFDKLNTIRQTDTEVKLAAMRVEMNAKMSTKRLKEIEKMKKD